MKRNKKKKEGDIMEIVLAKLDDLQNIKDMYTKIVDNMYENNIKIWNYDYPIEYF